MTKEGYQPKRTTGKPIPPNTGSNVHMKKDGYTWEDLDRSYWEGFDNAKNKMEKRIAELEAQIEKMKKYGKLLQDICDVMGNDPYMVWRGLEQRVLILWDKSEEEKGLEMAENILDRLLKIKPQDWAEIEKWEIMGDKRKMSEKSILEMVGGEKHINPHYNIKAEKMTKEELEKENARSLTNTNNYVGGDVYKDWKKGAEFGYNKANEWHYVKDGKPKDNKYVLIYTDIKNVYIARLVEDDYFITNKGGFVQMSAVIAWKEIVLPELPKESE